MLSFMREQEPQDSYVQKPPHTGKVPAHNAKEPQEQKYLTVEAKGKNVRKTTCLLAVLFGIGLLCLLFMIKKSTPQKATAATVTGTAEAQIETAITRLTGIKSEMFNRMDEIVEKFYEFSDVQQVKVNELLKNPFKYDMFWENLSQPSNDEQENLDTYADLMRQQARDLRLLCIMQSEQGNCCMISGKILYESDSIKGFKVRQIGDSFVKLRWDQPQSENAEMEIVLKLSE